MKIIPQKLLEFANKVWEQKECTYVQNIQNINNEEIITKLKNELEEPCRTIYKEAKVSSSGFLEGTTEWENVTIYKYETKYTDEIGKVTFVFFELYSTMFQKPRLCICCKKEIYGSYRLKN